MRLRPILLCCSPLVVPGEVECGDAHYGDVYIDVDDEGRAVTYNPSVYPFPSAEEIAEAFEQAVTP